LHPVEDAALTDMAPEALASLDRDGYLTAIAVADRQTMRDHTIQARQPQRGRRTHRTNLPRGPQAMEAIVANPSLADMDFADFADNVDAHGVFRGF
jgi:hypothetical protein